MDLVRVGLAQHLFEALRIAAMPCEESTPRPFPLAHDEFDVFFGLFFRLAIGPSERGAGRWVQAVAEHAVRFFERLGRHRRSALGRQKVQVRAEVQVAGLAAARTLHVEHVDHRPVDAPQRLARTLEAFGLEHGKEVVREQLEEGGAVHGARGLRVRKVIE
ncbi:hypothetical protein D3C72_1383430 [compost metagenome]